MLKKMIDGIEYICSDQEEKLILDFWAFNSKYPKYRDCNRFDGANPCWIDFPRAIEIHRETLHKSAQEEKLKIDVQIEMNHEDGIDNSDLLTKRKFLRKIHEMDLNHCKTIDDLINSVPKQLKSYWN